MALTDKDIQKLKDVFPTKADVRSIVKTEVRLIVREELEELHTKVDLIDTKVDKMEETLEEHTQTLEGHTRDLKTIKKDMETNLDKRNKIEVRVTNIEEKVGISLSAD